MEMISVDYRGSVMLARFNRGVTNALNSELVQALDEVLQRVKSDAGVSGLVLGTSNEKFVSVWFATKGIVIDPEPFEKRYTEPP